MGYQEKWEAINKIRRRKLDWQDKRQRQETNWLSKNCRQTGTLQLIRMQI